MQYRPEKLDELSSLYHGWVIRATGGGLIAAGILMMTIITPLLIVTDGRAGMAFLFGIAGAVLGVLVLRLKQVPHPSEFSKSDPRGFDVQMQPDTSEKV